MKYIIAAIALMMMLPSGAAAQANSQFELGVQVPMTASSQFDHTDTGIGGRLGWRPTRTIGIEAEIDVYPRGFPGTNAFSSRRIEGLFGATVGPVFGRLRPFARLRPGFLQYGAASGPVICIAIFPPPLSCVLAGGRTVLAVDIGGGVEIAATRNAFVRADAGDRVVRYPGPVFDLGGVRDDGFFGHDFRFAIGAGMRF
jgi:hypothetical protein